MRTLCLCVLLICKMLKRIVTNFFVPFIYVSAINPDSSKSNFDAASMCIIKACKEDLGFRLTIILKSENEVNSVENSFFNEMIETIAISNIQQIILSEIDDVTKMITTEDADWFVIIFVRQCKFDESINWKNIDATMKYLVFVADVLIHEDCRNNLDNIKIDVAKHDVTFIFKGPNKSFTYITFIPQIDEYTCNEVVKDLIEVNKCINGCIKPTTIFPQKNAKNLNKCPLNIGIGPLFPFANIKNREKFRTFDSLEEDDVAGSDVAITKIIAEEFNASYNLHYIKKKEENPLGQHDFIPFIVNGSLDICAGGLYRIYKDIVAYSGIYARQSVIWMYTADREKRSWINLITKVDGLYIFVIFYICYSFIWCIICKFDDRAVTMSKTLLSSWATLVGANGLPNADSIKQMILNLSYLVMCIHLSVYISVQFYSYFTILEPPELLHSNEDVMKSGRTAYLVPTSKYFVLDEHYVSFANSSEECSSFFDCLNKCLLNNGITVLLQGVFLNYQAKTSVEEEARVLSASENVLTVYYEMLIRKDSSYVGRVQKLVQRLFEGGIPERLFNEALGINVIGKAKSSRDNIISNSYSCQAGCKITLEQMAGVFYVWIVGCGISFLIFILEVVFKKKSMIE